jgi:hypothetical protein
VAEQKQDVELLGTAGCHLCEEAYAVLEMASCSVPLQIRTIDIAEDEQLLAVYAERIPVLRHRNGELCWPFGVLDAMRLLRGLAE